MTPVDHAISRLTACYSPPETSDPAAFLNELRAALSGMTPTLIEEGVSNLIKTRKHKSFPSIGDVRSACMDAAPAVYREAPRNVLAPSETEEGLRAHALDIMGAFPRIAEFIRDGKVGVLFDFVLKNQRLPADRVEWNEMRDIFEKVQKLLADADEVRQRKPGDPPPSMSEKMIVTMADAVLSRRLTLEEEICKLLGQAA